MGVSCETDSAQNFFSNWIVRCVQFARPAALMLRGPTKPTLSLEVALSDDPGSKQKRWPMVSRSVQIVARFVEYPFQRLASTVNGLLVYRPARRRGASHRFNRVCLDCISAVVAALPLPNSLR